MKRVKDESTDEDLFRIVATHKLDRIERVLKWLVVRKNLDYLSHDLEHNDYRDEYRKPILDEMFKLGEKLPDISDILEEKV